jgi:hypothetical protein
MGWATLSASVNRVAFDRLGSVSVVAGAVSGEGFLSQNSEMILGGEITIIDYLLTVTTALFGGLSYGDLVTVDSTSYKCETQPQRFDDGTFCRVPLVKLTAEEAMAYILDGGAAPTPTTPTPAPVDFIYDGGHA